MPGRRDDDVGMIADHGNASLKARAAARLPSQHHTTAPLTAILRYQFH
jgi:hypothetical protein